MKNKMSRKKKWDPKNYIRIYELCRDGLKLQQVANSIGIELSTLKDWRMSDETIDYAIERGQAMANKGKASTFLEQAFERLPPDLKDTWSQLLALQEEPNPEKRAEMLLDNCGKRSRQVLFTHALIHCGFRLLDACRMVRISSHTVTKWKQNDPQFLELMDNIHEMKKDFCEGALMGLVASGDTSAVLFTNKTLNRDRGYDPKITISHEGKVHHQLDISQLNLPTKVLETVMQAITHAKQKSLERVEEAPMGVMDNRVLSSSVVPSLDDEEAFHAE